MGAVTIKRRQLVISAVLGFSYAAMLVFGAMMDQTDHVFGGLLTLLGVVGLGCVFGVLVYGLLSLKAKREQLPPVDASHMGRVVRICLIALAVAWLVWYLILFPGIYGYDAPYWYLEHARADVPVLAQWSVPYSWLFYVFVEGGQRLAGSYELGLAALTLLQGVLAYYVALRALRLIARAGRPLLVVLLTVTFALVPTIPFVIFSSAQDSPFAALFLLICTELVELSLQGDEYWGQSPYRWIRLALIMLAFCLVRNTGVFILGLTLLAVPFFIRDQLRRLGTAILLAVVISSIYTGPISNLLGVQRYSTVEGMSSIIDHQIVEVYGSHKDSLSEGEVAQIERYFDARALDVGYRMTRISDDIKGGMNTEVVEGDLPGFVGLWVRLGIRHPVSYLLAAARSTIGLWYPLKSYPDERMWHPFVEPESSPASTYDQRYIDIESMSVFPAIDELLHYLYLWHEENFSRVPLLGVVSGAGLYFWILLFELGAAFVARRRRDAVTLVFACAQVLSVILGPVVLCRYVTPLMCATPLLVSLGYLGAQLAERAVAPADEGEGAEDAGPAATASSGGEGV